MNILLIIISALIYMSFGIVNFLYLIIISTINFMAAKHLTQKNGKLLLIIMLIINSLLLILIRLSGYFNYKIITPLGISYFSLQIISYLVDIYKGKYKYESNFLNYLLFIIYIPHLFIGPITRYDEIKRRNKVDINTILNGILRIIWGLFKKLIIASRIAIIIQIIASNPETYKGTYALLAMVLYSIELYSDFSGGIDIVLGTSKILGFNLPENFNTPYISQSIKEFWHRWHISLSTWLKDYIYIPLGGNKCNKIRKNLNIIFTFLISGLWHGINYLIWGLLNGILVIISDKCKTKNKIINIIITFLIVSFLWSFFIWEENLTAIKMIISVFTNINIIEVIKNITNIGLSSIEWIILLISIIILFIFDLNKEKIIYRIKNLIIEYKLIIIFTVTLIILVFGIYGIGFDVNQFIYSKF